MQKMVLHSKIDFKIDEKYWFKDDNLFLGINTLKQKTLILVESAITPFSIIKIQNVGGVLENSGNLQQDGHKNFENCFKNDWDNWP